MKGTRVARYPFGDQHARLATMASTVTTDMEQAQRAGHLVRDARLRAGLSLRALAARAGTSHTTLATYEAGRKTPGFETLRRILSACGFDVEVRLSRRVRERDGLPRGEELEEVLRLADTFPVRDLPNQIDRPAFPG